MCSNSNMRNWQSATNNLITGCGQNIIDSPQGKIISPVDVTGLHDPGVSCVWSIVAPPGERIQLTVELIDIHYDVTCSTDALYIEDRGSPGAKKLVVPSYIFKNIFNLYVDIFQETSAFNLGIILS